MSSWILFLAIYFNIYSTNVSSSILSLLQIKLSFIPFCSFMKRCSPFSMFQNIISDSSLIMSSAISACVIFCHVAFLPKHSSCICANSCLSLICAVFIPTLHFALHLPTSCLMYFCSTQRNFINIHNICP